MNGATTRERLHRSAWRRAVLARALLRNRRGTESVVGEAPVIVSMTSHGERLAKCFAAVESIGLGSMLPARIVLWLSAADADRDPPTSLRRLMDRGLEVYRLPRDYRSFNKLYPVATMLPETATSVVTADDDVLYGPEWLAGLLASADGAESERTIRGYRAKVIRTKSGRILPYSQWPYCTTTAPGVDVFLTGVSGIIYPVAFLRSLRDAGEQFLEQCPTADDVWFHRVAIRSGFLHRQLHTHAIEYPTGPRTAAPALMSLNVGLGANDAQICRTYDAEDIQLIERSIASRPDSG